MYGMVLHDMVHSQGQIKSQAANQVDMKTIAAASAVQHALSTVATVVGMIPYYR
jgi:hypothetical protein